MRCLVSLVVLMTAAIPPAAASASLVIRIVDEAALPVPGALVLLQRTEGGTELEIPADVSGRAALSLPPAGTYRLVVVAPGYITYREVVELGPGTGEIVVALRSDRFAQKVTVTAVLPVLVAEVRLAGDEFSGGPMNDLGGRMRSVAGVEVFRKGSINMDPTVRGLQETQVAMLVDGTRTFAAGPARMDSDMSHLAPRSLSEVRVVKGPYALTWGAGAMSAVNLVSYRPSFTEGGFHSEGTAALGYGSNAGALDVYGEWGGATDRARFHVSAGHREAGDYEDGSGEEIPGEYRSSDLRWSLGFRASPRLIIQYTGGYQDQDDLDYPGRLLDALYFRTRSSSLEATWTPPGAVTEVYGQAYLNLKDHAMNNDAKPTAQPDPNRAPPFGIEVDLPTSSDTIGGRAHVILQSGAWRAQMGGDYYSTSQEATRTISRRDTGATVFEDVVWPDTKIRDLGVYAQAVRESGGLRLGGTLRADFVDASAGDLSAFYRASTSGDPDRQETNISAAFSSRWQLGDGLVLSGGVGRVVRTAGALERYSDRFPATKAQVSAEFVGDPRIEPEKSLQLDLGLSGNGEGVRFNVDAFFRVIDDYITLEADPNLPRRLPLSPLTVFRYVNGDEAVYWGGEAGLRQSVGAFFSWRGSVSYVRARDTALDEPVFGIAPLRGEAAARLRFPGAAASWAEVVATVHDRQNRVAATRGEEKTPGYTVWSVRGGVELAPGLSLKGEVHNLGDKLYADHLNARDPFTGERIPEKGLTALLTLEHAF